MAKKNIKKREPQFACDFCSYKSYAPRKSCPHCGWDPKKDKKSKRGDMVDSEKQ